MGSGAFPIRGHGFVAYQRGLQYFPAADAVQDAALTEGISPIPPLLYNVRMESSGAPWKETIWFGGPGGAP
jgi:hypothetical protein